jgi:hypothetical protein
MTDRHLHAVPDVTIQDVIEEDQAAVCARITKAQAEWGFILADSIMPTLIENGEKQAPTFWTPDGERPMP